MHRYCFYRNDHCATQTLNGSLWKESPGREASLFLSLLEAKWQEERQEQRQGVSEIKFGADEVSKPSDMEKADL